MTKDRDTATQIALEHAAVRNAIGDLRTEIERVRGEAVPEEEIGKLSTMLVELRRHLLRHFELEEKSGLMSDPAANPEKRGAIEGLIAEHRHFERELTTLSSGVEAIERGGARLSEALVQRLMDFMAGILRHESVENELARKLVLNDAAGGA